MEILLKDLSPGEDYVFQLRAKNSTGVSQWSRAYNFTTESDTVAPNPVTEFTWKVSHTSFVGEWKKPTKDALNNELKDFKDYQLRLTAGSQSAIYYVTQERFEFSFEMNVACFGSPQPVVSLEVRVRDVVGNLSSPVSGTATNVPPADLVNFAATGIPKGISVSWDASPEDDIKQYEVYMSTVAGFTPGPENMVFSGLATSFLYSTSNITQHYFQARVIDVFNQPCPTYALAEAAPLGTTDLDTSPPGTPTNVTATTDPAPDGTSFIDVSWTAVASENLRDYIVRYSTDEASWQYITVPSDRTSARIAGLATNTDYYVGVASSSYISTKSLFANATPYPIKTGADATAPSKPQIPTVSLGTQVAQVSHNMKISGSGDLEPDVDYLEVHASTTSGFTPDNTTMRGIIPSAGPGISVSGAFYFPSDTTMTNLYWKVVAVDRAGNKSVASSQGTGLPGLIAGINILDATITNAKINDLSAAKLTAGTAFVNDLNVRSNLTIDATSGHIKSSNYSAASKTGWSLDQTGLFIYDGQIAAKSLLLQDSQNMVPAAFADFEFNSSYYHNSSNLANAITSTATSGMLVATTTSPVRIGRQALRLWNTSITNPTTHQYVFAPGGLGATGLNVPVSPGDYILSIHVRKNGTANQSMKIGVFTDTGSTVSSGLMASNQATSFDRLSTVITVPSGAQKVKIFLEVGPDAGQTGYDIVIDGVQFERKTGALTVPSPWAPPSSTSIDGGAIVTGSIRSSAPSATIPNQPAWSINTAGNMQIGDALVRGSLTVGAGAEANSIVQSGNYVAGTTGWVIKGDGSVEFNNGEFRGDLNLKATFEGKQYSLEASNSLSSWLWWPTNALAGQEPAMVFKGWSFTPNEDETGYDAIKPFQTILRNTPMGQFQIMFDPSQSDDPFEVDGSNERNADGTDRIRYYGFVDKRMGLGQDRDYNSIDVGPEAEYSNLFYAQEAVVAMAPGSMGSETRAESQLHLYSNADAYGNYDPYTRASLSADGSTTYTSKNLIADYLDVFDHPNGLTYYNTNIMKSRFRFDAIRSDLRMSDTVYKLRKGLQMTILAAGTNNPIIAFAPTWEGMTHTVVPGEEYQLTAWLSFPDSLDGLKYKTFMKTDNGVVVYSEESPLWHSGSAESIVSSNSGTLLVVPEGATMAQFGFEFFGTVAADTRVSMTGIELLKMYELQNGKRTLVTAASYAYFQQVGDSSNVDAGATIEVISSPTSAEYMGRGNPAAIRHSSIVFQAWDTTTIRGTDIFTMQMDPTGFRRGTAVEYRSEHATHRLLNQITLNTNTGSRLTFSGTVMLTKSTGEIMSSDWSADMGAVIDNASGYTAFIAQRAGLYLLSIFLKMSPGASADEFNVLEVYNESNSAMLGSSLIAGPVSNHTATFVIPMSAGQRILTQIYQEGANKTYDGSATFVQLL